MGGAKRKKTVKAVPPPVPPAAVAPLIYEATLGAAGAVVRVQPPINQAQAEALRKAGGEVVMCGQSLSANRALARDIEQNANGPYKLCPPHSNAGPHALPHYQPDPRPPSGHTFYETPNRHAF